MYTGRLARIFDLHKAATENALKQTSHMLERLNLYPIEFDHICRTAKLQQMTATPIDKQEVAIELGMIWGGVGVWLITWQ